MGYANSSWTVLGAMFEVEDPGNAKPRTLRNPEWTGSASGPAGGYVPEIHNGPIPVLDKQPQAVPRPFLPKHIGGYGIVRREGGFYLAPILTLFGEQVTKQFLSESISPLDCVIFGMAPIGIITAVVSVIRLYGKSWLKSVIGRAQEPHGAPEAELCSSTSEDVCEMWSNSSICRVFGRPKMLEVIVHNDGIFYPRVISDAMEETGADCGIALPKNLLGYLPHPTDISARIPKEQLPWTQWVETSRPRGLEGMKYPRPFAPFPNLSLNIGFQQPKRSLLSTAAAFGIILQSSFFIYAYWATFSNTSFYPEGDRPQIWSFVLAVAGTILLLACTLVMSVVRASIRGQRISKDSNLMEDFVQQNASDDLDWLAMEIAKQHQFPADGMHNIL
ncbi:hypothetical protein VTJ04DRAFT_2855 [Mycothermus thermophilus]|uniref:uncharacterized protein n=1 Tax=Humicola insolens TaxID=85995 RepID=UPI003742E97D